MKKNYFIYLFFVLCSMVLFMSCSEDKADDYSQIIDECIIGGYKGELKLSVDGVEMPTTYLKVIVDKQSATAVNLFISDFSFMGIYIGDVELLDCPLTENSDSYSFIGSTELSTESAGLKADVNAQGCFSDNSLSLNLDIIAELGNLQQTVHGSFNGDRLNGTEGTMADIISFKFDNSIITEQPVIHDDNAITFKVLEGSDNSDLSALVPLITVSEGATITPASGVAQDFSNGKVVTYTVLSEDYGTSKIYKVSLAGVQNVMSFSFDEWKEVGEGPAYHLEPLPDDKLASSVEGAYLLFLYGIEGFPIYRETNDTKRNSAIKLITMDTSAKTNSLVPALTAGSVFTGDFDMTPATIDRLKCTRFGISYNKKPITFRGWYKYAPGEKYIDGEHAKKPEDVQIIEGKTDECSIQAVLYEEQLDKKGRNIPLNGHDINTSDRRVAVAMLTDCTAKNDWTRFELSFEILEGKVYDENKKYQLAIVCSSSKLGDLFKGAGGSTLLIDEIEVIGE